MPSRAVAVISIDDAYKVFEKTSSSTASVILERRRDVLDLADERLSSRLTDSFCSALLASRWLVRRDSLSACSLHFPKCGDEYLC